MPRWPDSSEGNESGAGETSALGGIQDGSLRLPVALVFSIPVKTPLQGTGNQWPGSGRKLKSWEKKLWPLTEQLPHEEEAAWQSLIFPSLERLRAKSTGFWKIQLGVFQVQCSAPSWNTRFRFLRRWAECAPHLIKFIDFGSFQAGFAEPRVKWVLNRWKPSAHMPDLWRYSTWVIQATSTNNQNSRRCFQLIKWSN